MGDLIERLRALHVWPQSTADEYADTLTPRRIAALYEVGKVAHEAAEALTTAQAEIEAKDAEIADMAADRDALWKALHDATSIIGHAVPMDTVVLAGRKLVAREVWQAAHDLLYPNAARAALSGSQT